MIQLIIMLFNKNFVDISKMLVALKIKEKSDLLQN